MRARDEREATSPMMPNTRTTLAAWECSECKSRMSGYIDPHDFKPRRCRGVPQSGIHGAGRVCGGAMIQIYREEGR
jgi:hypothetical protein